MSEQKIPAPILAILTHAAEEAGKRDVAAHQEVSLGRQINDLDAEIQRLTVLRQTRAAEHAKAGRAREAAQKHAAMHRNAAAFLAQEEGLDPQKVLAVEPAPIPPEQDRGDGQSTRRGTCLHCGQRIHFGAGDQWWMHDATGASPCNPDQANSPFAEPVSEGDPLGQNGQEVAR